MMAGGEGGGEMMDCMDVDGASGRVKQNTGLSHRRPPFISRVFITATMTTKVLHAREVQVTYLVA